MWADHIFNFYNNLRPVASLPNGVSWLYPQQDPEVMKVLRIFLDKYYSDENERTLLLGINPGRFGAGVTGVNFTAPRQLKEFCGIDHPFKEQSELSAEFIYKVVNAYGGPEAFYRKFFIGSVCPLGFVQNGKNINYYDDKELLKTVEPFIVQSINDLTSYKVNRSKCICIGGEKNFKNLSRLNDAHGWFGEIVSVPHPRFVMQYRRKKVDDYVSEYLRVLAS
jgi:hypothetical protein